MSIYPTFPCICLARRSSITFSEQAHQRRKAYALTHIFTRYVLAPSPTPSDDPSDDATPLPHTPHTGPTPDRNPSPTSNTIAISRLTHTYLGDVLDHAILLTTSLTTMSASASSMISLIFNTMSVAQNETIKQLTYVTILFLPLTFLSGYFGMNFETMPELKGSSMFFWGLAAPITAVVAGALGGRKMVRRMRDLVWRRRARRGTRRQGNDGVGPGDEGKT